MFFKKFQCGHTTFMPCFIQIFYINGCLDLNPHELEYSGVYYLHMISKSVRSHFLKNVFKIPLINLLFQLVKRAHQNNNIY